MTLESYKDGDILDPDRRETCSKQIPRGVIVPPLSSVTLVKKKKCIRRHFAGYLDDTSIEGKWLWICLVNLCLSSPINY